MLDEENISYEKLQVEQYVTDLHDYWKDNRTVFKLDSVSFLYIWGNYNRVFDKLYVFYCVVSGNLLHTFTFGVVKSVVVLLFVNTAIFIGLLVVGLVKMDLRGKEVL